MTEQRTMLTEMVDRLFRQLMSSGMPDANNSTVVQELWSSLQELGLSDILLPESAGGFGGLWQDAFVVFNLLGFHALPLPLGETIVAKKLLMGAGMDCPDGILTIGICDDARIKTNEKTGASVFSGTIAAVPWGRAASSIVVACQHQNSEYLALLSTPGDCPDYYHNTDLESGAGVNEAGEPRDDLYFEDVLLTQWQEQKNAPEKVFALGALLRTAQMSGALASALQLSLQHVNERVQFGRSLSKFQVVQHQLALLAEDGAAVNCAAMAACLTLDKGADKSAQVADAMFEIAASKLRANRSVAQASSIAHQMHGAIGFTKEHQLHYFTQRLWSWRSEFGNERYWANYLGKRVIEEGAENLWRNLTARSDRS